MRSSFDIVREMDALRREIESAFQLPGRGPRFRYSFLPGRAARSYPLVNVSEDEDHIYVQALAPGLDPDSVKINAVGAELSLSGEKPLPADVRPDAYHRNERAAGRFTRTMSLPSEVDADKANADYRNGILTVTLPKAETAKPRKISVQVD